MKDLFKLLLRFVPPYKRYLILNILFNLLIDIVEYFLVHANYSHTGNTF